MLHYDHYYTKGVTHSTCEDYATQGDKPTPFIVLSDGCSASPRTDLGAQILTLLTRQIIENAAQWPLNYSNFGKKLINNASKITKKLNLPNSVLDATIMVAFLNKNNIIVYVYGDGCLLFKDYAGHLGTLEIAFTHNAPYYLTYWYDEARQQEYAKSGPNPLLLIDSVRGQSEPKPFQTKLIFRFSLNQFKMVAIASDGVSQCIDTCQQLKLPVNKVAAQLLDFKNLPKKFVKHHTKNVLKQYAQQGIFPADDLSIGVFIKY